MLGLFRPPCPIDLREKVWAELRMGWLVERFGWQQMRDAQVILPTREFFPLIRDRSQAEAEQTFQRVCQYLGVQQGHVRLQIVSDDAEPDEADGKGHGGVTTVRVPESLLADQEGLIAAMARLVAFDRLWRSGNLTGEESDASWLVELATVFFGMGIFGANTASERRQPVDGAGGWWTIRRHGHLPARVYGYAMAMFAVARHEYRPAWARMLGHDAADTFRRGVRYLKKAADCVFDCETSGLARPAKSDTALESDLRHGADSVRLAALWDLLDRGPAASHLVDAARECLRTKNAILRSEAARVIGAMGPPAAPAAADLIRAFASRHGDVRRQSALAVEQLALPLDMLGPNDETVYEELLHLLEDPDPRVVQAAAHALSRYGRQAEGAGELMIRPLCRALVACDYQASDYYFEVLEAITADVEQFLDEHVKATHPDLYPLAVETLEQSRIHRSQQHAADPTSCG